MDRTSTEHAIVGLLDDLVDHIEAHTRALARKEALTVPQRAVLRGILLTSAPTPATVADWARMSRSTTTSVLDKLEGMGLCCRGRGQGDRRKIILTLTPAGRARAEGLPNAVQDLLARRLQTVPNDTLANIHDSLGVLMEALSAPKGED